MRVEENSQSEWAWLRNRTDVKARIASCDLLLKAFDKYRVLGKE
jgi:hypothetical protein